MEEVLQKVRLWDLILKQGGLDSEIAPELMSHGEQQLLILGRAVLQKCASHRKRYVLILDEATSNLDASSEAAIHKVVEDEFKHDTVHDTVISVAHRLDTLRDMDKVILLEGGRITKIGPPSEVIY
jgi:ATP-binding cassette subfamily C (CFTR/MRP) protein 1